MNVTKQAGKFVFEFSNGGSLEIEEQQLDELNSLLSSVDDSEFTGIFGAHSRYEMFELVSKAKTL